MKAKKKFDLYDVMAIPSWHFSLNDHRKTTSIEYKQRYFIGDYIILEKIRKICFYSEEQKEH